MRREMGKPRLSCIQSGKCSCRHPCYFLFIPSLYLPSLGDGGGKTTCSVDAGSSDLYLEGSWWLFLLSLPYPEAIHQEQQQAWAKFSLIQDPACKGILKRARLEGKGQEEGTTAKQAVPSGKRSCLGNWLCSPF